MREIAAIILAAGKASRFREKSPLSTKLIAEIDDMPMVRVVAHIALATKARPVIVVTGHAREEVVKALKGLPLTLVHNPDFADGLAGSLKHGLAAVPPSCIAVMVLLADMPRVSPQTCDRLMNRFAASAEETLAVAPSYLGQWGNPLVLGRTLFPQAAKLTGDQGARKLLASAQQGVIEQAVDDAGVLADADTPDALAAMKHRAASK